MYVLYIKHLLMYIYIVQSCTINTIPSTRNNGLEGRSSFRHSFKKIGCQARSCFEVGGSLRQLGGAA